MSEPLEPQAAAPTDGAGMRPMTAVLIGGAIGVVVVLLGVAYLLATGDDEPNADVPTTIATTSSTAAPAPTTAPATTTTTAATTTLASTSTSTSTSTTTPVAASAALIDPALRFAVFDRVLEEQETTDTLATLALATETTVASAGPVFQLCSAFPLAAELVVDVVWERDGESDVGFSDQRLYPPSDGTCLFNVDGVIEGTYQVIYGADDGTRSPAFTFTVGAAEVMQSFRNDTGVDLCAIEIAPVTARYFEKFAPEDGGVLVPAGQTATLPVADVEHEARGVDCTGAPLDAFRFRPGPGDVALSGASEQISDAELRGLRGLIGSSAEPFGPATTDTITARLTDPSTPVVVATEAASRTLCAVFPLPAASFDGTLFWEFDGVPLLQNVVTATGGVISDCIAPEGDTHPPGTYQAFVGRNDLYSDSVATFTVGAAPIELTLVNDLGIQICRIGASPSTSRFYSRYINVDTGVGDPLQPGDSATIAAAVTAYDVEAVDCDGVEASSFFEIVPSSQPVNLSGP